MKNILKASSIIDVKIPALKDQSQTLARNGLRPNLNVILVGNNDASLRYVGNKEKFCQKIDAAFSLIRLPEDVSENDFLNKIHEMNTDPSVTGCFVQLPVPKHLQHLDITQLINPDKDVDGFHLNTVNDLYMGRLDKIIPCTPKGIVTLLKENNIKIEGSNVVIIGRSHIVGKPLCLLMQALNATVTLCHSRTKDLIEHTKNADIIVSAVGIPHLITKKHLNTIKKQILIDVGMNQLDGKLVGDIHFADVEDQVEAITPVPGGVGPMTVFSLMENLLKTTEIILQKRKS